VLLINYCLAVSPALGSLKHFEEAVRKRRGSDVRNPFLRDCVCELCYVWVVKLDLWKRQGVLCLMYVTHDGIKALTGWGLAEVVVLLFCVLTSSWPVTRWICSWRSAHDSLNIYVNRFFNTIMWRASSFTIWGILETHVALEACCVFVIRQK